jgi:hypothetical protein
VCKSGPHNKNLQKETQLPDEGKWQPTAFSNSKEFISTEKATSFRKKIMSKSMQLLYYIGKTKGMPEYLTEYDITGNKIYWELS